jgi:hypothetical protein
LRSAFQVRHVLLQRSRFVIEVQRGRAGSGCEGGGKKNKYVLSHGDDDMQGACQLAPEIP